MRKIKVIIKRPDEAVGHMSWISDTLENLQRTVGGPIEMVKIASDCAIICNEEGKLRGLPYNFTLLGEDFVGEVIFAGVDGEELADVPLTMPQFRKYFAEVWK